MSSISRQRKMTIGLSLMEEAIADALKEAREVGRDQLADVEVSSRVGLEEEQFAPGRNRSFGAEFCRNLLWRTAINGEVQHSQRGSDYIEYWSLAN